MNVLAHEDEPIVVPVYDSASQNILDGFELGDQVGNPLYTVIPEHMAVLFLLVLVPVFGWLIAAAIRRRAAAGHERSVILIESYRLLAAPRKWAAWSVTASALIHGTLVFTHEVSSYTLLYSIGAVMLGVAARWIVLGRRPKLTALVVVGSIMAFWFLGAPPDQVGVFTKLIEMFALALLVVPGHEVRRTFAPAGVVTLIVATGIAVWIGAFASAGAEGGHHGGEYPEPGTVVPYIDRLDATLAEEHAADDLFEKVSLAVAKYSDPAVAEGDGYQVGNIVGTEHHADNPAYLEDGRIFDPERPETLVYASTRSGPVLIGAMFQMPGLDNPGPRVGGPLTVWHSHENICFTLAPPALVGLMSPYGSCPAGAFNIPLTNEMIHAWVLPSAEDQWGHLDDEWLEHYLDDLDT